jgi:hypothetical protein
MSQEIESIRPAFSLIIDDGDWIINSTGPVGKAAAQLILPLAASVHKITVITDGEMKVLKRQGNGQEAAATGTPTTYATVAARYKAATESSAAPPAATSTEPADIQDRFAADLAAGRTGEAATGESPSPTPGPNDPVKLPTPSPSRRKPVIYQDAAAPPAPELAEAEMDRLVAEAAAAEQDSARLAEDQRFQRQQAVQAQVEPADIPAEVSKPRRREPRQLAATGRPCGRCGGGGQIAGEAGFAGACPVCQGQGTVKTWDRSLKVR